MTSKNGKKAAFELGGARLEGAPWVRLHTLADGGLAREREGGKAGGTGKGCVKKAQHQHSIATAQYNIVSWISSYIQFKSSLFQTRASLRSIAH